MTTQMEPEVAGSPKTERRLHNQEVSNWRNLEETVKAMGVNTPAEMTVILHDGTGSGGLPRFRSAGVRNKNNEDFACYSEMVAAGWFDSGELHFGPVDHTHNGVDEVHMIHNVELGHTDRRETATD
jgi:hypothetical protein